MRRSRNLSLTSRVSALNSERLELQLTTKFVTISDPASAYVYVLKTALTLRSSSLIADDVDQLGRRQPDWILVSKEARERIAIIDLCRPSDVHQTQLQAAAIRKQQTYQPLVDGLSYYTEQGWVVHVFPWIVGIRGMIDPSHVQSVLRFLGIQRKHWQLAIEQTALASVQAFHFLHKVSFWGPLDRVQQIGDAAAGATRSLANQTWNKSSPAYRRCVSSRRINLW